MNRREFFNESVWLAAVAGMVSSGNPGLSAQTRGTPVRQPDRYNDSLILERKAFKWPYWTPSSASTSGVFKVSVNPGPNHPRGFFRAR